MQNQLNRKSSSKKSLPDSRKHGDVDTSLLYEELHRAYKKKKTDLEVDFRSLVDWIKLGDKQTHKIHPYPAKLLPHIVHFFVNSSILSKPQSVILDPFCGSGTVALEASLSNRIGFTADANPLARLITKVKTQPYETQVLRLLTNEIINKASHFRTAPIVEVVNEKLWYSAEKKRKLEILLRAINTVAPADYIDFFKVCFSVVIRKLSYADPAISVPVRLKQKLLFSNTTNEKILNKLRWIDSSDPLSEFYKVCEMNVFRIEMANKTNPERIASVEVGTDARNLMNVLNDSEVRMNSNSIPLTITSPPYGSAQKYIRSTSLSLNWLGLASVKDLVNLEALSIGSEHLNKARNSPKPITLPLEFEELLDKISKVNSTRATLTRTYLNEMSEAIKEISRVTSVGGHIVFVVGNNQVSGETLDNAKFITLEFEKNNINLEMSLVDNIKSRGLMTRRNKTASIISHEHILVFKKIYPI